jgi:hypothetical protein
MQNIKEAQSNGLYQAFNSSRELRHKTLENRYKVPSAIIFIDSGLDDYQSLANGTIPEAEVIVLDSTRDGVVQITEVLQGISEIAAIHIVSHGSPGCLYLGNTQLSLDTLERYASQLQTWATHLTLSSLLLYGCNVAAGDAGEEFVQELHQLTGANIAASADRIGNAAKGGSWYLEHHLGQINTGLAFLPELMQAYSGVFAVSFNDASNFPVGTAPSSIATGDFDGDGDLDLVTANFDSNNVSVLLNNGQGSFSLSGNFAVGRSPVDVAVGDFNEDGNLDLVTADFGSPFTSATDNTVSVLLGNGNGSFGPATQVNEADIPLSVAVADFNRDNNLDLAVGRFSAPGIVSVLFGNGTGSFPVTSDFTTNVSGFSISVGDFNNDNNPDIVTGGRGDGNISLLLGNGTTSFQPPILIQTEVSFPAPDAVGDFNGDGNQDLVVGSNSDDEIAVLLGNGDGSFSSPSLFTTGGGSKVTVGDFNSDGKLDIAAASAINNNVSVLLGNGDGSFVQDGTFNVGSNPQSITVGDFNGDSKLDIATANSNSNNVSVLLNTTPVNNILTVDTLVDENDGDLSPGDVSLREAIAFTQAGGMINFDPSLAGGTITLTQGELVINKNLIINGLGAAQLTISGNNADRVFNVDDGDSSVIDVTISDLTISNGAYGSGGFGGGIRNQENLMIADSIISGNRGTDGGGIYNTGTLTITNSAISNNTAGQSSYGGGIDNNGGTLKITDSTISGNTAGTGGGIASASGSVEVINSTISSNSSTADVLAAGKGGGGIYTGSGTLALSNSTISNNSSMLFGGGIYAGTSNLIVNSSTITQNTTSRDGGGIFINPSNGDLVAINNTIIAKNYDINSSNGISPDISGNFDTSRSSYNLIGDGSGSNFTNGVNGNIVGTSCNPIDPLLGPLQDNGGPTFTHALLPGSPAIDAANPLNNVFIDQRGVTRPQGSGFDIGAFEVLVSCPGSPCSCEQNSDPWNITNTNHPLACLTGVDTNLITPVDCLV